MVSIVNVQIGIYLILSFIVAVIFSEMEDKTNFLLACSGILNHVLKNFANLIVNDNHVATEYPPLLLHISVFINIVKCMDVNQESMSLMLRETDFMNLVLKMNNNILAVSNEFINLLDFVLEVVLKYKVLRRLFKL